MDGRLFGGPATGGGSRSTLAGAFEPVQIDQVELGAEAAGITPRARPDGRPYTRALVLVRLHTYPIGMIAVPLEGRALTREELDREVRRQLADEVQAHLLCDGLERPGGAAASGGSLDLDRLPCQAARQAVLSSPPSVSVVIATRDRAAQLERCIASVLACAYPAPRLEIVVVDNCPRDDRTRQVVDEARRGDDRVSYVRCDRPGASRARNVGVARAAGEIAAVIDDDAIADAEWVTELARGFAARPAVACVTGLVVPSELETPAQQLFEQFGGFNKGYERRCYEPRPARSPHPLFPFNAGMFGSGNNVAFRRSLLLDLGGYDADLGPGTQSRTGEDLELFIRILRSGHAVAYEPGAIVEHEHRREMDALVRQVSEYGTGLTAALTSTVVRDRSTLPAIAGRIPHGLHHLLSPRSSKNSHRTDAYPRALRNAELRGMLRGPTAYLRARRGGS